MRIALLTTRIRTEERLLLESFEARGVHPEVIDLRAQVFVPGSPGRWTGFDLAVDRSVSATAGQNAVRILDAFGVRCVNPSAAIDTCSDKLRTTLALELAGVPTPRVRVAFDQESALAAVEELGYPAVLKPTIGSWGRLLARVNDRDAAEAVIEHKLTLGSFPHHVLYVQEYVEKPMRDIRVFVVGGEPVAAITRESQHWVTNTARGGRASGLAIGPEMADLCRRAAASVGGDVVAIDLLECPRRGLLVNELNHSMEFRNSIETSGVDIPGLVADYCLRVVREGIPAGTPATSRAPAGAA
ncbi:MAG: lysine biosynthesis protein LysX [Phycisphaerales bacterium]|nr:lysine biosynthesis protein LysX [Phycisphaerales bacterium]